MRLMYVYVCLLFDVLSLEFSLLIGSVWTLVGCHLVCEFDSRCRKRGKSRSKCGS